MSKLIKYSEIFSSFQGEGNYTGHLTEWLRFFTCNLQCDGFGQIDPTNPESYELPYLDIDTSKYETLEQLPVFSKGCDSSYSWSKKFSHLQHEGTPRDIVNHIVENMTSEYNPEGHFDHGDRHMCFTGGEPLLRPHQIAITDIIQELMLRNNMPSSFTVETNGTQPLSVPLSNCIYQIQKIWECEFFFSVSPKLYSVSGERSNKAIKPEIVAEYYEKSPKGQLKFVVSGTKESWNELEEVTTQFQKMGIEYPIWVMPVGATVEGQEIAAADVAKEAIKRGYQVAARVHTYVFGNMIGT